MNNDLDQFSEERLKQMVKFCETSIHGLPKHFEASEVAALARIALAAKQAKPVACNFGKDNGDGTYSPTYDYWPLPSYIKPHKDWPVTLFYDGPQPAHTEQDGYWYEVECYKYKGPAKLCAGNDGAAWFLPGSDLLVDNDEVKVIARAAAPKPESE